MHQDLGPAAVNPPQSLVSTALANTAGQPDRADAFAVAHGTSSDHDGLRHLHGRHEPLLPRGQAADGESTASESIRQGQSQVVTIPLDLSRPGSAARQPALRFDGSLRLVVHGLPDVQQARPPRR